MKKWREIFQIVYTNHHRFITKKGFTLSEVLVVLAVIGVISALTVPILMTGRNEQQAIVSFKKTMQILNEVGQINLAMDGFDYTDVNKNTAPNTNELYTDDVLVQSVWGMVASKAQVDVQQSVKGGIGGECKGKWQIFFNNGTALCYAKTKPEGKRSIVINAVIDTNGLRGPNGLFTCDTWDCTRTKNVGDQFAISLTGTKALPGFVTVSNDGSITDGTAYKDYAAMWAMRK